MKNKKFIWIIVGILLIGLLVFILTRKERTFNELTVPITNVVTNKTTQEFLTPIVKAGLYELKIDSNFVMIQEMTELMKNGGLGDNNFELKASLVGNKSQNMLYVNTMDKMEAIKILSHELIHLDQYQSGRLVKRKGFNTVLWDGKIYDVKEISYLERPWEIEAFKLAPGLEKKIKVLLLE